MRNPPLLAANLVSLEGLVKRTETGLISYLQLLFKLTILTPGGFNQNVDIAVITKIISIFYCYE